MNHPLLARLRRELFASRLDGLISLVLIGVLLAGGMALVKWMLFQAQWAVIQANSTLFAVGRYPLDQQWRLWLITTLLAMATGLSWGVLRAGQWPWPRKAGHSRARAARVRGPRPRVGRCCR